MAFTSFNSFNSFIQIPAMTTANGGGAGVVTTLAGSISGYQDGTGISANFNSPSGIVIDSTNTNLYVVDQSNNIIRKIVISTGVVTRLAGTISYSGGYQDGTSAQFNYPFGITIDKTNTNLYVTDQSNNLIRNIVISSGVVSTLGSYDAMFNSVRLNSPSGIAFDSTNTNLYVAERSNHIIRKIVISTGVTYTLAGSWAGYIDSGGTSAQFNSPSGIVIDSTNTNLYVADSSNNVIRKIVISSGLVSTIAMPTLFYSPSGIAIDSTNTNLYVSERSSHIIRKIVISTGVVTTLAGSGVSGYQDGPGTSAQFNSPSGIAIDSTNTNLYVVDKTNNRIRKITL